MKRFAVYSFVAGLALFAMGSGSPVRAQASPNTVVLSTVLDPSQEPVKVKEKDKKGTGEAFLTFNLTRDSGGNITAATVDFQIFARGFPEKEQITGAEVGQGAVGVAGSVVIDTGISPEQFNNKSVQVTVTGVQVSAQLASQILAAPNGFYFHITTDKSTSGAARGQLAIPPVVTGANVDRKSLTVTGTGFEPGAIILVNMLQLGTKNDDTNPTTTLFSKKGGRKITHGQTVIVQALNPDGGLSSPSFLFSRP